MSLDLGVTDIAILHCCSVTRSCLTLCDPMECSKPGFPVLYHLPEFAQTHVLGVAIQPSCTLSSPSPPAFTLSQLQGLFQWVSLWPLTIGLPRWLSGKESTCQCRRLKRCGFNPWVRKISWNKKWQPTPVFLPEKSHGQRSLGGYSPYTPMFWMKVLLKMLSNKRFL